MGKYFWRLFFFLIFVEYSDHGSFSGGGGGVGDDRHWGPVATVPAVLDGQGDAGQRDAHENDDENATYPPSELTFFNLQNALFRLINEIRKKKVKYHSLLCQRDNDENDNDNAIYPPSK